MNATLGFINGNIITMKDKVMKQAVAVKNDRIIRVGTNAQILAMSNGMTHVIDLKGKTPAARIHRYPYPPGGVWFFI